MNLFMYLVSKNITPAFCDFLSMNIGFLRVWHRLLRNDLSVFTKLLLLYLLLTSFQIQSIKVVVLCLSASTAVHPDQDHAGVGRRHRLQVENTERCRPQPGKKFSDARFLLEVFRNQTRFSCPLPSGFGLSYISTFMHWKPVYYSKI